jgi:hypothetical protein
LKSWSDWRAFLFALLQPVNPVNVRRFVEMSWLGLEAEAAGLIWSEALDRYVHPDEFTNESLKELEILKNG